ncbi:NUDIX hydrolase [Bulleidia sp. zg-1006]|uniref:NUDIX hydrolase n=1 Tax=Bulleidia sp. zg-1006 TaxID=2806552 RepID=UPI001EEEEC81|nr:NUDIX hydrolase [Bulleidia sp. zg-1006]
MKKILNEKGESLEEFLQRYDSSHYEKASQTADCLVFTVDEGKLKVLLIQRRNHPFIHDWAMPGGFLDMNEDLDGAALRELKEETSLSENIYFEQLYTFSKVDRDPRTRIITTVYLTMVPPSSIPLAMAADDALNTTWFEIRKKVESVDDEKRISTLVLEYEDISIRYQICDTVKENYIQTSSTLLSKTKLAGDHYKAINRAMDYLQDRVMSDGLLFHLLPKNFSLKAAQLAYEAVLHKKVDTPNFRRDIRKYVTDIQRFAIQKGRRVKLYQYNPLTKWGRNLK